MILALPTTQFQVAIMQQCSDDGILFKRFLSINLQYKGTKTVQRWGYVIEAYPWSGKKYIMHINNDNALWFKVLNGLGVQLWMHPLQKYLSIIIDENN